jgi:uncharacterized membrane protein YdbT with pleckstrin-like domain
MVDSTLLNYITAELARGVNREQIVQALLTSGWQQSQIDETLNSPTQPTQIKKPVRVYSEVDFPITTLWIFKISIVQIPTTLIFMLIGIVSPRALFTAGIFVFFFHPISLMVNWLTRKYFMYRTEADFLFLKQGILSKKQYHLPYGVIQHVVVKQDLFDRLFGLASLLIENAVQSSQALHLQRGEWAHKSISTTPEIVGSNGNKISIPGLRKTDAEALKTVILQKIKDHPLDDNASGL